MDTRHRPSHALSLGASTIAAALALGTSTSLYAAPAEDCNPEQAKDCKTEQDLVKAIDIMQQPAKHQADVVKQAQDYMESFKLQNAKQVHMFFVSFFNMGEDQPQHKFWILGAINDVLLASVEASFLDVASPVQFSKCRVVLTELLRNQGPKVLDTISIPKLALTYVLLIKLDNAWVEGGNTPVREWPDIIKDLVSLVEASADVEHQKTYIRFIVKTL